MEEQLEVGDPIEFAFVVPKCSPGARLSVQAPDGVRLIIPCPVNVNPGMKLVLAKDKDATWQIVHAREVGEQPANVALSPPTPTLSPPTPVFAPGAPSINSMPSPGADDPVAALAAAVARVATAASIPPVEPAPNSTAQIEFRSSPPGPGAPAESAVPQQQLPASIDLMAPPPIVDTPSQAEFQPPPWAEPLAEPSPAGYPPNLAGTKPSSTPPDRRRVPSATNFALASADPIDSFEGTAQDLKPSQPQSAQARVRRTNGATKPGNRGTSPGSPISTSHRLTSSRTSVANSSHQIDLYADSVPGSDNSRAPGAELGRTAGSARRTTSRARSPNGAPSKTSPRRLSASSEGSTGCIRSSEAAKLKELIRGVYQRKKPGKLSELDALLEKHRGDEKAIYEFICKKYGETTRPWSAKTQ